MFRDTDLRELPLVERKAHLKNLIARTAIQFSESFEVDGPDMFAHACKVGLEGVVSKLRDSRYSSGRGHGVKKTCAQRETLPIAGFAIYRIISSKASSSAGRKVTPGLCWKGPPRFRRCLRQRPAGAIEAADPQDAALR
jgi:ATP-dependent DNA ligase